jgi:ABC-2 type transport system permease protein
MLARGNRPRIQHEFTNNEGVLHFAFCILHFTFNKGAAMAIALTRTTAVARRALRQLIRDRRFLALSLVAPLLIIYLLKVFFDSATSPFFKPTEFIVPMGAFIVHFITYILCAIVLVRERTAQTLARMFINGYQKGEIIGGYVIAYTTLATLQSLLVLIELRLLFELDYDLATLACFYLVVWLLAVISMALGIFISNFARNEGQVFPFIPLVILPSVFLSGLIVSVEKLPEWAQWLGLVTPLYYGNKAIQSLLAGGVSNLDWANLAALPLYGAIVLTLATLTLSERD